jgi:hypothetical protein
MQTPPQETAPPGHVHVPATHVRPPVHATPHMPQFRLSVATLTQRPPQVVSPARHCAAHAPAVQTWSAEQTMLQSPHAAGSTLTDTQVPLHAFCDPGQMQLPITQVEPPRQRLPQAPQFDGSVARFRQPAPQRLVPGAQMPTHTPALHTCAAEHDIPQALQFAASLSMSVQVPPHGRSPGAHPQVPSLQTSVGMHAAAQPPQWALSLLRSTQARPQGVSPAPQAVPQRPTLQTCPAAQTTPQAPQFVGSDWIETQMPEQDIWPAAQTNGVSGLPPSRPAPSPTSSPVDPSAWSASESDPSAAASVPASIKRFPRIGRPPHASATKESSAKQPTRRMLFSPGIMGPAPRALPAADPQS